MKVTKTPRTTKNIPCTLIEKESGEITISSHVEAAKEPVVPKTVRVRTISEPRTITLTSHVEEFKRKTGSANDRARL